MAEILTDTKELAKELRERKAFFRLVAAAQKAALSDWRDRARNPGLAGRFTHAAHRYYGFAERGSGYLKRKGGLPDFIRTGRLRALLLRRKPQNKRGDGEIRTVLKIGGGALNWLRDKYGSANAQSRVVIAYRTEPVKAHVRMRAGQREQVRAHVRRVPTETRTPAPESHADQFGDLARDHAWIEQRTQVHLRRALKAMQVKRKGKLKNRYIEQLERL